MAFYEQLFPPSISADMEGGPAFLVRSAFTLGGQRYTNRDDPYPLHEFTLAQPVRRGSEFEELRAFFWAIGGSADGFRYRDWSDFRANAENSSLTLVSGTTWQLNRLYAAPGRTAIRPITKPVTGLHIYRVRSGAATDITASSTISTTTGRVVIAGHAAGDQYHWVGEFHVPVAFVEPRAVWRVLGSSQMMTEWSGITLRETREIA